MDTQKGVQLVCFLFHCMDSTGSDWETPGLIYGHTEAAGLSAWKTKHSCRRDRLIIFLFGHIGAALLLRFQRQAGQHLDFVHGPDVSRYWPKPPLARPTYKLTTYHEQQGQDQSTQPTAMASPSSIRRLSLLLLVLSSIVVLLAPPSAANDSNVLLTGDILPTDGQLTNGDATFVMQGDCNLVLYNKRRGFQSNTHGNGGNCTLTLNDLGQFVIKGASSSPVWTSTLRSNYTRGSYAAVLRPDGEVAIYGPAVWSTPNFGFNTAKAISSQMMEVPVANNVLFSSQVLYDDAQLTTRDYTFVMRESCNLALFKRSVGIIWQTGTVGGGEYCFLRLDHRGQLTIADDQYKTVWRSQPASKDGDYVLVVQINGQAVVYGPVVWSTAYGY